MPGLLSFIASFADRSYHILFIESWYNYWTTVLQVALVLFHPIVCLKNCFIFIYYKFLFVNYYIMKQASWMRERFIFSYNLSVKGSHLFRSHLFVKYVVTACRTNVRFWPLVPTLRRKNKNRIDYILLDIIHY